MKFKKAFVPALVRKGYSLNDVAEWLGIGIGAAIRRVAQGGDFSKGEIKTMIEKMKLTPTEAMILFFDFEGEENV
jgi:transposase